MIYNSKTRNSYYDSENLINFSKETINLNYNLGSPTYARSFTTIKRKKLSIEI